MRRLSALLALIAGIETAGGGGPPAVVEGPLYSTT